MYFWRHGWSINDWYNQPNILYYFKNFGFINSDNTEIDDTQNGTQNLVHNYTSSAKIKWKYDTYANSTFNNIVVNWNTLRPNDGWGEAENSGVTGMDFYGHNGRYNLTAMRSYGDSMITGTYQTYKTFFIPLKNNGFFFNERNYGQDNSGYQIDNDKSQIPKLWTTGTGYEENYEKTAGRQLNFNTIGSYTSCVNILGIPVMNDIIGNDFIYLILSKYKYGGNNGTGKSWIKIIDSVNDNNLTLREPIPDFSQYNQIIENNIGTKAQQATADTFYQSHINLARNVCTLVKFPYGNTFLNNLYIMTTAPTTITDEASFFTINNRNFMKVFENIVVELPSN